MFKYILGIYSFFILSLLYLDSSPARLSTFIHFYCCQHLLSFLFLHFLEKLVLSGQTPGSLSVVGCTFSSQLPAFQHSWISCLVFSSAFGYDVPFRSLEMHLSSPWSHSCCHTFSSTFILLYTCLPGLSHAYLGLIEFLWTRSLLVLKKKKKNYVQATCC